VTEPPGKKQTLLGYLSRGIAMVHLDARRPGVVVPPEYEGEAHLRLNLSYRFQIPDLEVGERGVQATLSFRGRHFRCTLPWTAVFGITSQVTGDGQVWPEDLPGEVANHLSTQKRDGENQQSTQPTPAPTPSAPAAAEPRLAAAPEEPEARLERRARGRLAAVESDDANEPTEEQAGDEPPPEGGSPGQGPKRGHLRLVR
jgi:stringent starvation protein B